jgi:Tol biopolymer transport system component
MHRRDFLFTLGALTAYAAPAWARADITSVTGELTQLTKPGNGDNRASYMPDGKSLLFVSSRSGRSQIWSMDPNGDEAHLVHESKSNDYGRVASSPDGTRLCFSSDRDGENAIYVLDLKSGAVARISDPAFWSFGPTWSSHDLIAYFSKKGGNRINTWTVRPDGTEAKQITNRPGESRQPWWSRRETRLRSRPTMALVRSSSGSLRKTAPTRAPSPRKVTGSSRSGVPMDVASRYRQKSARLHSIFLS